jgi:HSP20 family protein
MSMSRWTPMYPEMRDMNRVMDRLVDEMRPGRFIPDFGESFVPSVDMFETTKEVVVKMSVPGMKAEDIDVHISDNMLTVKGERKVEEEVKKEDYYYQEQRYGSFSRSVTLPSTVDPNKSEAMLEDGILTLKISKSAATKAKQIRVQAKQSQAKKISQPKQQKKPGSK